MVHVLPSFQRGRGEFQLVFFKFSTACMKPQPIDADYKIIHLILIVVQLVVSMEVKKSSRYFKETYRSP